MEVVLAAGLTGLLALAGTYLTIRAKVGTKNGSGSVIDMLASVLGRLDRQDEKLADHDTTLRAVSDKVDHVHECLHAHEKREEPVLAAIDEKVDGLTTRMDDHEAWSGEQVTRLDALEDGQQTR